MVKCQMDGLEWTPLLISPSTVGGNADGVISIRIRGWHLELTTQIPKSIIINKDDNKAPMRFRPCLQNGYLNVHPAPKVQLPSGDQWGGQVVAPQ